MGRGETTSRGDRGSTAIEFVLLTPLLFLLMFVTVQFALYFFANQVAESAARAGAREARTRAGADPGSWAGQARRTTALYVRQLGPQLLDRPEVHVVRPGGHTVGVEVTGHAPALVPGMDLVVRARSQGPVERFVEDGAR